MKQSKQIVITLDIDTTQNYMKQASARLEAEVDADCEPSGETIKIEIAPPYGNFIHLLRNDKWIEMGEAEVKVIDASEDKEGETSSEA